MTCGNGLKLHTYCIRIRVVAQRINVDGCWYVTQKFIKIKLNIKLSTKEELVGVNDYTPCNIWLVSLLQEQGCDIQSKILLQYNQSLINMVQNRRNSCTGNPRHLLIIFLNHVDRQELKIEYCPSHVILADIFTKPLHGRMLKKLDS